MRCSTCSRWLNTTTDPPLVSITVCAYNEEKFIEANLKACLAQTYPNIEVIALDPGSSDRTLEIMKTIEDPRLTILETEKLGLSETRQMCVDEAKGDFVAITDADTRPTPSWIEEAMPGFEDDTVAAVTGRTVFESNEHLISELRSADVALRYARRKKEVTLANGPCSILRKDRVQEVGGFEKDWYHAEDTQVSYRLIEAGYRIIHRPSAIVRHQPEDGLRLYWRKRRRDARAFVRILKQQRSQVKSDDFVTPGLRVQPPLFAFVLPVLPAILIAGALIAPRANDTEAFTNYTLMVMGGLLVLALGISTYYNFGLAREVAKRRDQGVFTILKVVMIQWWTGVNLGWGMWRGAFDLLLGTKP